GSGPTNCDDNIGCTHDTCSTLLGGCFHTPDNSLCPSPTPCAVYVCDGNISLGGCSNTIPSGPRECDGNPCTSDQCIRGNCQVVLDNTNSCDDHNACTTHDQCG